jgi:type II secretory pathway component PulF
LTTEPALPPSNDDASPLTGSGEPTGAPQATWEEDEGAMPGAGPWEAENGDAEGRRSGSSSALKDGPWGKASKEDEQSLYAAPPIRKEPWRLSHLMILIVVVAVLLWVWVTLGMVSILFGALGAIVLAITIAFVAGRMRATRQDALLSILSIAADRDLPLAPAVAAFADQFGGRSQRRVLNMAAEIHGGTPLAEALEQPPRIASRDAILMARIGQETGLLARALRLAGGARAAQVAAWSAIASRLGYLLALILIAQGISGFHLYFFLPKLEAIFVDFRVPLPQITVSMIYLSRWLFFNGPIGTLIVLAEVACVLYLPFSFGGWMNYQMPIFDRLFSRRHTALVLRALSVVIEANRPIATGLAILAEHYPARWFRRRLAKVQKDVRLGADWIDALWRAGVIRKPDAEVLASAASVGNLAWACRELADTAERRQQLRMQVLTQTLVPVAIIVLGLVVALLAVGYFIPLVTLIQSLADL